MTEDEVIFNEKISELEKRQQKMLDYVRDTMQRELLKAVTDALINTLVTEGGMIKNTSDNLDVLRAFDRVFANFNTNFGGSLYAILRTDFQNISGYNSRYYESFRSVDKQRYVAIKTKVNNWLKKSLGMTDAGNIVPDGYFDLLINDKSLLDEVKTITFNAVAGRKPLEDLTSGLQQKIVGVPGKVDGALVQYYETYAYDKYQEYDRANNDAYASSLLLRVARYSGGLIDDSRQFCIDHNDKLFTIEEMSTWIDDPNLPRTAAERKSGQILNYVPQLNMGRWRCRHTCRWITRERAIRLRPDLKIYYKQFPDAN